MPLDGLRVWLTGASTGIGAALVDPLVRRGARVAITARRSDLLDAIIATYTDTRRSTSRLRSPEDPASFGEAAGSPAFASPVLAVPADVTDRDAVTTAARRIEAAWGGIDLAIFNAGGSVVANPQSAIRNPQFEADDYTATMTLNYFSVVYGIDAVLPGMLARGSGHIAAVASLAGYRPTPLATAYGASKAAVIHLLDGLRFDLEPRGVRVTVINPGFVRTPLTARNTFKMPFLVEAADAAERIVRGLERGKREIHFPAPLSWTMKLMRILPYALYAQAIKRLTPR